MQAYNKSTLLVLTKKEMCECYYKFLAHLKIDIRLSLNDFNVCSVLIKLSIILISTHNSL